ncbi:Trm112 family protein [Buttiauxella selenatireducens]|uniref:Trm112 family protein n=1 Tax=Buttiauxella selenatireducens TaxID=3073902 RepID=A0ABY9SFI0_9ENTR|nr:Trm112 family protein [Buttiauxella sp. R73]WMY75965.1 Trm112 family protein [Buttiauxella sp. R73]
MFDTNMLELLICPISHLSLKYDAERQCLISADGQHEYQIVNGIPVLMPDTSMEE